jgi:SAM-dependent methyltransferase
MEDEKNYIEINKESWNKRTEVHFDSEFYDNESFIQGKNSLPAIDLDLLGDLNGKSVLHLQCHFGQDTISMHRLGAEVTGVDLSDKAIDSANELAELTKSAARFICCDIYDLPQHLDAQFDVVYTSYGTIGWLPDLNKWAQLIARYLKPKGKLVFVEFHPVVWMFDNDFNRVQYNYFNAAAIVETEDGTYTDREAAITQKYVSWNHPISDVVNSLAQNGLQINSFDEYDYSPYDCFNGTVEFAPNKFRIEKLGNKIPMIFALVATRS